MVISLEPNLPIEYNQAGVPLVRGTRVPIHAVLAMYERGLSPEEIVEEYPSLKLGEVHLLIGIYLSQVPEIQQRLREGPKVNSSDLFSTSPEGAAQLRRAIHERDFGLVLDLWARYVDVRHKLRAVGLSRSNKQAEAELAEWLVQRFLGGEVVDNRSNPGYDVTVGDMRIEVKSLSKDNENPNGYKITDRDRNPDPLNGPTHYAFVFFRGFVPDAIYVVPTQVVQDLAKTKSQIKRGDLEQTPSAKLNIDLSAFNNAANGL